MANKKITELPELLTPANDDWLYIVDASDVTESIEGTSKKIKRSTILPASSVYNAGNGLQESPAFTFNLGDLKADTTVSAGSAYFYSLIELLYHRIISRLEDTGDGLKFGRASTQIDAEGSFTEAQLLLPASGFANVIKAGLRVYHDYNLDAYIQGSINEGTDPAITEFMFAKDMIRFKANGLTVEFPTTAVPVLFSRVLPISVNGNYADSSGEIAVDLSGFQPKGVRITNATTTGSYAVDWNAADVWQLTLTGATTITDTNLPTGTATKVIELFVKGAFAITLPAYWEATPSSGTYTGAKWNHIVISCVNGTTSSEKVIYSLETLAT